LNECGKAIESSLLEKYNKETNQTLLNQLDVSCFLFYEKSDTTSNNPTTMQGRWFRFAHNSHNSTNQILNK